MSIKSSQILVREAQKKIQTISPSEVKNLIEKKEITLIDLSGLLKISNTNKCLW